jgi:hypothetical protein
LVVVEDRFHLKPLFGLLGEPACFHVLAVSQRAARLLDVDRWSVCRSPGEALLPTSLEATLPEVDGEPQLQIHSAPRGAAVYHGQGAGENRRGADVQRYLQRLQEGLHEALAGDDAPIVLAGVRELMAALRQLADDPRIVAEGLDGNPEHLSDGELAERARPLARGLLGQRRARARNQVDNLAHTDRVTSRLGEIVVAAIDGRVGSLFVDGGQPVWGHYDPARRSIATEKQPSAQNEDLLDLAATKTFQQGGDVFVVEAKQMPVPREVATAVLRY